jgi:hypothetical protein
MYKRDSSHASIKAALLAAGRPVKDVAHLAGLGCDLITRHLDGTPVFLELKSPGPPSRRKLTESEVALQAMFPMFYRVAVTPQDALRAVGLAA